MESKSITIKYNGSVLTQAGFRSVTFIARAEQISAKRAKVIEVVEIDDEPVKGNMSRTGANRQRYYGFGAAGREQGKTKNLSACEIIN